MIKGKKMNIFDEYEAEQLAETKKQIAAEDAAWKALPQSERDRINAEREQRTSDMADAIEQQNDEEE